MSIYRAQLRINNHAVWHDEGADRDYLIARLLSQLEKEPVSAQGQILQRVSEQVVFQCRKVAGE